MTMMDTLTYLREAVLTHKDVRGAIAKFRAAADTPKAPDLSSDRKFLAWLTMAHVRHQVASGNFADGKLSPDSKLRKKQAEGLNVMLQNIVPELRPAWRKVVNVVSKTYRLAADDPEYGDRLAQGDDEAIADFDRRLDALSKRDPAADLLRRFDKLEPTDRADVLQTLNSCYDPLTGKPLPKNPS